MKIVLDPLLFEWDKWNTEKNWRKHKVNKSEAESVFLDKDKQEYPAPQQTYQTEKRSIVVGKSNKGRMLFVVYTIRNDAIRIISIRDLNKRKEAHLYEKAVNVTKI